MAHYAKIKDGKVVKVIVAEASFFDTFIDTSAGKWIQTSYNNNIRKNFAGIGYTYDEDRDAFIPPKPFNSWTLNETTCLWEAPVAKPDDGQRYNWNETNQTWDLVG
jgi:hypothetical protein